MIDIPLDFLRLIYGSQITSDGPAKSDISVMCSCQWPGRADIADFRLSKSRFQENQIAANPRSANSFYRYCGVPVTIEGRRPPSLSTS